MLYHGRATLAKTKRRETLGSEFGRLMMNQTLARDPYHPGRLAINHKLSLPSYLYTVYVTGESMIFYSAIMAIPMLL